MPNLRLTSDTITRTSANVSKTAPASQSESSLFIALNDGSRPCYTSGDHVEGVVRVDPTSRPIHVGIKFKGFSSIHDSYANGIEAKLFECSENLFQSTGAGKNFDILRKGTAKDGKVELPFRFIFPQYATLAPPADRSWVHSKDSYDHPRFQHRPGFVLPPTCTPTNAGSEPLAPKIVYTIEARMDVASSNRQQRASQELKYMPPAPSYVAALLQPDLNFGLNLPKHACRYKLIRSRKLLPGYRESSKFGKLRDVLVEKELFFGLRSLTEVPFARFNVFATPARVIVIGSEVPVAVTIQHVSRSRSLPYPPDLFLRRVRVQLLSTMSTYLPKMHKEMIDVDKEIVTLFEAKFEPSERPLHNGLKLSDLGNFKMEHNGLLPSFTCYGLALEHELQVQVWGECVGREFLGLACREQVQIVSAWKTNTARGIEHAMTETSEMDTRPEYTEHDPMSYYPPTSEAETQQADYRWAVQNPDTGPFVQDILSRQIYHQPQPAVVPPPSYART